MSNETQKLKRKLRNLRYRQKLQSRTVKEFKPSKLDIEEKNKFDMLRAQELSEKYGTINESCILFRRIYESKTEHELSQELWVYYFNHLQNCVECQKWVRTQGFDLNGVGDKKYEELRGYETLFKDSGSPSSMGENRRGFISICSTRGTPLEKDGSCSMCARGCD